MHEMNIELYQKLSYLQWLLHRQQLQSHAEHGPMADPTRGQGRVLAILQLHDGISTKDLSYLLGIRIPSLNELLVKLEKADYITRQPSSADKRIMMTHLTEKGRNEKREQTDLSNIFTSLLAEEQQLLADFLDRIITTLEQQVGNIADEDTHAWMHATRARMGGEMFDRLRAMKRGFAGLCDSFDPRTGKAFDPRHGFFHHGHDFDGLHGGDLEHWHKHPKQHRNKRHHDVNKPETDNDD